MFPGGPGAPAGGRRGAHGGRCPGLGGPGCERALTRTPPHLDPRAGRPCVDCHAFEFMQRALQDLRKTAYSLDARVSLPRGARRVEGGICPVRLLPVASLAPFPGSPERTACPKPAFPSGQRG